MTVVTESVISDAVVDDSGFVTSDAVVDDSVFVTRAIDIPLFVIVSISGTGAIQLDNIRMYHTHCSSAVSYVV